jgi:N-carbamoyl-L-amino-acid hydrolase
MKEAGLDVHIDAAGNIVGTRPGREPSLKPLLIGSHIDSVPMGGNYDGDVGSISAIEVAQVLNEKHAALRHPLEIILFQNEEGGPIGNQALGEGLERNALAEPHSDEIGVEVFEAMLDYSSPTVVAEHVAAG